MTRGERIQIECVSDDLFRDRCKHMSDNEFARDRDIEGAARDSIQAAQIYIGVMNEMCPVTTKEDSNGE